MKTAYIKPNINVVNLDEDLLAGGGIGISSTTDNSDGALDTGAKGMSDSMFDDDEASLTE